MVRSRTPSISLCSARPRQRPAVRKVMARHGKWAGVNDRRCGVQKSRASIPMFSPSPFERPKKKSILPRNPVTLLQHCDVRCVSTPFSRLSSRQLNFVKFLAMTGSPGAGVRNGFPSSPPRTLLTALKITWLVVATSTIYRPRPTRWCAVSAACHLVLRRYAEHLPHLTPAQSTTATSCEPHCSAVCSPRGADWPCHNGTFAQFSPQPIGRLCCRTLIFDPREGER